MEPDALSLPRQPNAPPNGPGCGPLASASSSPRNLRQLVFEAVRAAGQMPRVDVAKQLNVSPASVTATVADLIDAKFLQEFATPRQSDSSRGRPPVALGVRAGARHVVGIKLSDHRHSAVVVDFAGGLVADVTLPRGGNGMQLAGLLDDAEAAFAAVLKAAGLQASDIAVVGLGVPGMVDNRTGTVLWSPLMQETNVDLRGALQARIDRPVEIDNDANLVTLAELWFGAGRRLSDFVVVTIEHGLGMGLVLNNQVYRGAQGLGMEIGHTKVQLDGALCRCGQRGCLEAYVADYALIREARVALNLGNSGVKSAQALLESLYDQAKSGNQAARAIFGRAGRYLAAGLANIVNIFDPSLILLSGERMEYDYLYAEEVVAEMRELTLQTDRPAPPVEIHAWGDLIWARGAAALALDRATQSALSSDAA